MERKTKLGFRRDDHSDLARTLLRLHCLPLFLIKDPPHASVSALVLE